MDTNKQTDIADAIYETLRSVNVNDSNFEPANVVDVLNNLAKASHRIANMISPSENIHGEVSYTLTEAVDVAAENLGRIADAISDVAKAMHDANWHRENSKET